MLKPKRKTDENTVDAMAPSSEFIEARKRWAEISAKHSELTERHDGLETAASLARNPQDARRVSEATKAKAFPYKKLAQKRGGKVIGMIDDLLDEIEESAPAYFAEAEDWRLAQQREVNRVACLLQPRQRQAVKAMVHAVEALSQAIADERAVRDDLRRLAPFSQTGSPNLPDLSSDLEVGCLSDWGGIASNWAKRLRKLGILED